MSKKVKYHVSDSGVVGECTAEKRNCPVSGETRHFETREEAEGFALKENVQLHGNINSLKKNKVSPIHNNLLKPFNDSLKVKKVGSAEVGLKVSFNEKSFNNYQASLLGRTPTTNINSNSYKKQLVNGQKVTRMLSKTFSEF